MSIARKVVDVLSTGSTQEPEPSESEESERAERAGLFECEPCSTTFIDDEMADCPYCDDAVERVPTERELGMR